MRVLTTDLVFSDRYRELHPLGNGANGIVVAAVDRQTGQKVAIKRLRRGKEQLSHGLKELSNILHLEHPRIVRILDFAYQAKGETVLVYEMVEGGNLRDILPSPENPWSNRKLKSFARQILEGLGTMHQNALIHGDLKPENILIESQDEERISCKIADLGSALRAPRGTIKDRHPHGSPAYLAPERFYNSYSFNVDLYALGIILYEIITGDLPFLGEVQQIARQHLQERPNYSAVSDPRWRDFLSLLLEKDPKQRFQSAPEALDFLNFSNLPRRISPLEANDCQNVPTVIPGFPLRAPERFARYQAEKPFSLPSQPLHAFAIGSLATPGLIVVYSSYFTWYTGNRGAPMSFYLPARGHTAKLSRRGYLHYASPEGVQIWRPEDREATLFYRTQDEILALAIREDHGSFAYATNRHVFLITGAKETRIDLRGSGLPVHLSLLPCGHLYVFEYSAPTHYRIFNPDGELVSYQRLPGCLIDFSPYNNHFALLLGEEEGQSKLSLLSFETTKLDIQTLPQDIRTYDFTPTGLLYENVGEMILLGRGERLGHSLGSSSHAGDSFHFALHGDFFYTLRQRMNAVPQALYHHL